MAEPQKKFVRLGNLFAFNGLGLLEGGRIYFGNVIASRDAIYLISGYASLRLRIAMWLLPHFLVGAYSDQRAVDRQVFQVPLKELDTAVTSHPDWPLQLSGGASPFRVRVLSRFHEAAAVAEGAAVAKGAAVVKAAAVAEASAANESSAGAETSVSAHWFSLGVTVRCGPDRVWIRCSPFGRREILQTLAAFGWTSDGQTPRAAVASAD